MGTVPVALAAVAALLLGVAPPAAATATNAAAPASVDEQLELLERNWREEYGSAAPTDGLDAPADLPGADLLPGAAVDGGFAAPEGDPVREHSALTDTLLAKAEPNACFTAPGEPAPAGPPCAEGEPKVDQGYVWGLTRTGGRLWFGTGANVLCLVLSSYLEQDEPIVTDDYTCEYGASAFAAQGGLPAAIGDWRPPNLYTYDPGREELVDLTPRVGARSAEDATRLRRTLGIRAAGADDGIVLFGGPDLSTEAVNLFAFDVDRRFLGSATLPGRDNVRNFVKAGTQLYAGVGDTDGGGSVLRWTGDRERPFRFEDVADLDGEAAELAVHDGQLYAATWPASALRSDDPVASDTLAGLWRSPELPGGRGLRATAAGAWEKVWQVDAYEPDPLLARAYGVGALHSYGGQLHWGTMHVPLTALGAFRARYGEPEGVGEQLVAALGTWRAISIFRAPSFDGGDEVELLYGAAQLPTYAPATGWTLAANRTGPPRYGPSGFGNPFNNYTWTMDVYDGQLMVGTMDHSLLLADALPRILERRGIADLPDDVEIPVPTAGADLWRFPAPDAPAVAESLDGLDNPLNYGFRTMVADDRHGLFIGTANPMNLATGDDGPQGGWELHRLR